MGKKEEEKSTQANCSNRQATRVSAVEMMDGLGIVKLNLLGWLIHAWVHPKPPQT
jgi:hypothetical protein